MPTEHTLKIRVDADCITELVEAFTAFAETVPNPTPEFKAAGDVFLGKLAKAMGPVTHKSPQSLSLPRAFNQPTGATA